MSETRANELLEGFFSDFPNVIRDIVPFKVLLLIVNGVDNPKSIGEGLGVKPPSVIYQLQRLKRIGLVALGEKEGKIQHYKINWDGLERTFLRVIRCSDYTNNAVTNPLLRDLIKEALSVAGRYVIPKPEPNGTFRRLKEWQTNLEDFFREFNIALIKSFPEFKNMKYDNPDLASFANFLKGCYERYKGYYGTRGDLFWRVALERAGIVEIKFSSCFNAPAGKSIYI